jgi:hypothetical protein
MQEPIVYPIVPVATVQSRHANIPSAPPHSANRNAVDFPLCDAAVRNTADGEWKLADAIVAECSEPGKDGVRNGSHAKMQAMRQEIAKNHGVELSLERIRKLRKAASTFPPGRRRPGVSLEAHLEAGAPDVLDELAKDAPLGTVFTRANVRALKSSDTAGKSTQKGERLRQEKDERTALQNVCRKLEQENEVLRQRYEDSCRSAGREPEPLPKPPTPDGEQSATAAEDMERAVRRLLLSRGIDPKVCQPAIANFIKAVLAPQP